MAHANDGGGSIRIPASCCGVFGLKPTRARNPLGPDFGDMFSGLVAEHAVTRSVRDSAALLDATAGRLRVIHITRRRRCAPSAKKSALIRPSAHCLMTQRHSARRFILTV